MNTEVHPAARMGLPRWTLLAFVPFILLAACAVYLRIHWNQIPARFPIHWGAHGPNGWSTRTFLGVYGDLIFGAGLSALLISVGLMGYLGSQRSNAGNLMLRAMVGTGCFLGLIFSAVGLLPLGFPPGILIAAAPLGLVLVGILLATAASARDEPETPESGPPLFVPKKEGWGYSFNFANRYSWIILGTLFGGLALLLGFVWWTHS
jgi:hypothetical protein